ncbi:hypothetical protein BYT27DRAFT_7262184 [Phlegmacium glaucopus]|nr:hypothetical protein BYT27DRAFT_7262184 [Phlegmacium glaucopus]
MTSKHTDEVEITASVAHSQPLENTALQQGTPTPVLDTSDTPRKRRQMTPSSEQPLKVPTSVLNEDNQLQGTITVSQHGSSESTTQNPIVPYLESMRNMTKGTEGIATKPEYSSKPGTPLESSAVSISKHNLLYKQPPHSSLSISKDTPSHQPMPPASRKGLLKDIFLECSSPHHFNDELMLSIIRGCNNENLCLTKISANKWKAVENIDL